MEIKHPDFYKIKSIVILCKLYILKIRGSFVDFQVKKAYNVSIGDDCS